MNATEITDGKIPEVEPVLIKQYPQYNGKDEQHDHAHHAPVNQVDRMAVTTSYATILHAFYFSCCYNLRKKKQEVKKKEGIHENPSLLGLLPEAYSTSME
jgi:hypothetical protein